MLYLAPLLYDKLLCVMYYICHTFLFLLQSTALDRKVHQMHNRWQSIIILIIFVVAEVFAIFIFLIAMKLYIKFLN